MLSPSRVSRCSPVSFEATGRWRLINIAIIRAFVRLRQILSTHQELAEELQAMERKYDKQFKVKAIFDVLRQLMAPPPEPPKRPIGFVGPEKK